MILAETANLGWNPWIGPSFGIFQQVLNLAQDHDMGPSPDMLHRVSSFLMNV